MKKYLFFMAIISLSLTACTSQESKAVTDGNLSETTRSDEGNSAQTATAKSNLTNEATSSEESAQKTNSTTTMNNESSQDKNQEENLAAEYQYALIKTSKGDIKVKFYTQDSPNTVNNFMNLAKKDYYSGTRFHRIIKDFMIQGGDSLSKDDTMKARWGTGGPGYQFADEFNDRKLVKGSLAMANSGPNTNGSQFFIVTAESTPWLDGKHTNFGEVVEGMSVVEAIESMETEGPDRPVVDIAIKGIELIK